MFSDRVRVVIDRVDRLRDQVEDHWQIPRDEALVLAQLVRIGRCISICEIGTSYGFSTLHFAAAASEHGGRVHSIDADPKKVRAAGESLREAGLAETVTVTVQSPRWPSNCGAGRPDRWATIARYR